MTTEFKDQDGQVTDADLAAARRRIGIEMPHGRPGQEYATIDSIRHFAEGLGDINQLYHDPEYARKTRWGKMIAHPTMMLIMGVSEKRQLTAEERERGKGGGLAGVHGFYSGDDIEWFRPIREGDRLTVKGGLARIDEHKSAFSGTTWHFTSDEVYTNQNGEFVGVARHMSIRAERKNIRGKGKYSDLKIQTYTPEDMAKIDADYEREYIRGNEPRYWEDVQVGEEIVPVVKGPYTATSYICFAEGTGPRNQFHRCHSVMYQYRKRHPRAFPLTEYGFPDAVARVHWEHDMAHRTGLPAYYDYGGERIGWLSQGATNWMGNDGFLRKLKVSIRRFNFYGDTIWIRGKVTNKEIKDGEYWVWLDLVAVNQLGDNTAFAEAAVILPSRVAGPVKVPAHAPEGISIYL